VEAWNGFSASAADERVFDVQSSDDTLSFCSTASAPD
jgi:hypothetical protein